MRLGMIRIGPERFSQQRNRLRHLARIGKEVRHVDLRFNLVRLEKQGFLIGVLRLAVLLLPAILKGGGGGVGSPKVRPGKRIAGIDLGRLLQHLDRHRKVVS